MEPVMSSDTSTSRETTPNTTSRYALGDPSVTPSVESMTYQRLAYDDAATTTEMASDCARGRTGACTSRAERLDHATTAPAGRQGSDEIVGQRQPGRPGQRSWTSTSTDREPPLPPGRPHDHGRGHGRWHGRVAGACRAASSPSTAPAGLAALAVVVVVRAGVVAAQRQRPAGPDGNDPAARGPRRRRDRCARRERRRVPALEPTRTASASTGSSVRTATADRAQLHERRPGVLGTLDTPEVLETDGRGDGDAHAASRRSATGRAVPRARDARARSGSARLAPRRAVGARRLARPAGAGPGEAQRTQRVTGRTQTPARGPCGGRRSRPASGPAWSQWNESPQAQEPPALGLSIVNPCFSMVSTKSMVAPLRYGLLIRSTTTSTPVEVGDDVAVEVALVEEELVAHAGAATGLHGDAQLEVVTALLVEEALHLRGGRRGQVDAVRADLGLGLDLLGHAVQLPGVDVGGRITSILNGRTPTVIPAVATVRAGSARPGPGHPLGEPWPGCRPGRRTTPPPRRGRPRSTPTRRPGAASPATPRSTAPASAMHGRIACGGDARPPRRAPCPSATRSRTRPHRSRRGRRARARAGRSHRLGHQLDARVAVAAPSSEQREPEPAGRARALRRARSACRSARPSRSSAASSAGIALLGDALLRAVDRWSRRSAPAAGCRRRWPRRSRPRRSRSRAAARSTSRQPGQPQRPALQRARRRAAAPRRPAARLRRRWSRTRPARPRPGVRRCRRAAREQLARRRTTSPARGPAARPA